MAVTAEIKTGSYACQAAAMAVERVIAGAALEHVVAEGAAGQGVVAGGPDPGEGRERPLTRPFAPRNARRALSL
jgi:hypothetical protein